MPEMLQQILLGVTVVVVFAAFMREWFPTDLVAMAALVLLLGVGIVSPSDLKDVFGSPAPIVVACMFILSAALERTGTIEALGHWFENLAGIASIVLFIVTMTLFQIKPEEQVMQEKFGANYLAYKKRVRRWI